MMGEIKPQHKSFKTPIIIYDYYEILQWTLTMKKISYDFIMISKIINVTSEDFVILPMSKSVRFC